MVTSDDSALSLREARGLYFERNDRMARKLVGLCRDGRPRLVVVGAGHVVGERGVPRLLEAQGFDVRRVHDPSEVPVD